MTKSEKERLLEDWLAFEKGCSGMQLPLETIKTVVPVESRLRQDRSLIYTVNARRS